MPRPDPAPTADPLVIPSFADVRTAAARLAPHVRRTPVLASPSIDELAGVRVHFKAEHLQRGGAFKFRGAMNALLSLDEERAARGVCAHSSGNHAAALALAASVRGVPCHVVMPEGAPAAKVAATRRAGASITFCAPTMDARERALAEVAARTGAVEVHPYDNPAVIAGQGTAALELLGEVPDIGLVVAPVSGGGLVSGTAIAVHGVDPSIAVGGAEPATADDARRSLAAGHPVRDGNGPSIADGLLAVLSDRTFMILVDHDVEVVTVTEDQIVDAMVIVFERLKQVVEPSAAVALAAVLQLRADGVDLPHHVGVILSGGNVDLGALPFRRS